MSCFENGRQGLADAVGVSLMSVTHWYRRGLPIERARDIALATRDKAHPVTLAELRPDFFGEDQAA